ncbi:MAG TPA: HEAT repeat domain-containing protein [Pyrinomonadaceae bacterium]|nr:HEAT repeat domain-containing protein [Pyrinomonadaceae bacterium]
MITRTTSRLFAGCFLAFTIAALVGLGLTGQSSSASKDQQKRSAPGADRLVVHEWGTFTSVAGRDGVALDWRPLNGPSDLPKFVYTMQDGGAGFRHRTTQGKGDLTARVRMETPVLYFYSGKEMEVSVKVDFPKGKITEWYPRARDASGGIDWGRLKVMPGAALTFPVESAHSHYYPAREVDAAPVQVCSTDGNPVQQEKFLFYRGVGTFDLPLTVKLENENVVLKNLGQDEIAHLVIFENRGGRVGYRLCDAFTGEMTHERPALDKSMDALLADLKAILVASGLYEKEAEAMIKTWRTSWFEEGLRVFYILPRRKTDEILPVTIEPRPQELVRVLVGRAEVITPEMEKGVRQQLSMLRDPSPQVREAAMQEIRKYGRFSEPILKRLLAEENDGAVRARIRRLLQTTGTQAG